VKLAKWLPQQDVLGEPTAEMGRWKCNPRGWMGEVAALRGSKISVAVLYKFECFWTTFTKKGWSDMSFHSLSY
jgi:hypothetical protein